MVIDKTLHSHSHILMLSLFICSYLHTFFVLFIHTFTHLHLLHSLTLLHPSLCLFHSFHLSISPSTHILPPFTHSLILLFTNMHTHTHIHIHTHSSTFTFTFTDSHTLIYIYIYIHIYSFTLTFTHSHTLIYIHIHIHSLTHLHTHTSTLTSTLTPTPTPQSHACGPALCPPPLRGEGGAEGPQLIAPQRAGGGGDGEWMRSG